MKSLASNAGWLIRQQRQRHACTDSRVTMYVDTMQGGWSVAASMLPHNTFGIG
ncbi:hypothetical protein H633G_11364 [Metarhizium anisopliae BRIP 53284]|nr:hypothetical protein H633G_11364 [Metarhizium anisopliae BRIP 53284]